MYAQHSDSDTAADPEETRPPRKHAGSRRAIKEARPARRVLATNETALVSSRDAPLGLVKVPPPMFAAEFDFEQENLKGGWRFSHEMPQQLSLEANWPIDVLEQEQLTGRRYFATVNDSRSGRLIYRQIPLLQARIQKGEELPSEVKEDLDDLSLAVSHLQGRAEFSAPRSLRKYLKTLEARKREEAFEEESMGTTLDEFKKVVGTRSSLPSSDFCPLPPHHPDKDTPKSVYVWQELVSPDFELVLQGIGDELLKARSKSDLQGILGDICSQAVLEMIDNFMRRPPPKRRRELTALVFLRFLAQFVLEGCRKSFFAPEEGYSRHPQVLAHMSKIFTRNNQVMRHQKEQAMGYLILMALFGHGFNAVRLTELASDCGFSESRLIPYARALGATCKRKGPQGPWEVSLRAPVRVRLLPRRLSRRTPAQGSTSPAPERGKEGR